MSFATDNAGRMAMHNPGGIFTTRLTATNLSLAALISCSADDQGKLSLRMAKKQMKKAFRNALGGKIGMLQGSVQGHYGMNAPEVTEIFGAGRSAFSECADDSLEAMLINLVTRVTARVADLGAPLVADAQALLTGWNTVYDASEGASEDKLLSQMEKRLAREAVQLDLFKNLLTITLNYPDDPEKVALYMTQSLLEDHPAGLPLPGMAQIGLQGTDPGSYIVSLAAENDDPSVTGYDVFERFDGGEWVFVGDDVPGGEFTRTGLAAGDYEVKAVARNATGEGSESEVLALSVPA